MLGCVVRLVAGALRPVVHVASCMAPKAITGPVQQLAGHAAQHPLVQTAVREVQARLHPASDIVTDPQTQQEEEKHQATSLQQSLQQEFEPEVAESQPLGDADNEQLQVPTPDQSPAAVKVIKINSISLEKLCEGAAQQPETQDLRLPEEGVQEAQVSMHAAATRAVADAIARNQGLEVELEDATGEPYDNTLDLQLQLEAASALCPRTRERIPLRSWLSALLKRAGHAGDENFKLKYTQMIRAWPQPSSYVTREFLELKAVETTVTLLALVPGDDVFERHAENRTAIATQKTVALIDNDEKKRDDEEKRKAEAAGERRRRCRPMTARARRWRQKRNHASPRTCTAWASRRAGARARSPRRAPQEVALHPTQQRSTIVTSRQRSTGCSPTAHASVLRTFSVRRRRRRRRRRGDGGCARGCARGCSARLKLKLRGLKKLKSRSRKTWSLRHVRRRTVLRVVTRDVVTLPLMTDVQGGSDELSTEDAPGHSACEGSADALKGILDFCGNVFSGACANFTKFVSDQQQLQRLARLEARARSIARHAGGWDRERQLNAVHRDIAACKKAPGMPLGRGGAADGVQVENDARDRVGDELLAGPALSRVAIKCIGAQCVACHYQKRDRCECAALYIFNVVHQPPSIADTTGPSASAALQQRSRASRQAAPAQGRPARSRSPETTDRD
ncbi:hypothetical protein JKP88DRAFT_242298 [Tribonema minus]|uniref:Uncharacterized protein n=1 Tax=Tribonema minus TaxID=303371 RepID=A0A835YSV5_9STRA|nr:hypothetical protein JKP88DRAFT_242298 [Tribonema minus]